MALSLLLGCASAPTPGSGDGDAGATGGKTDVFGEDDRRDVHASNDHPRARTWAQSTALLVAASLLREEGPSHHRLDALSLMERLDVCEDEPFAHQPSVVGCSSSLVGPDLMLTAGHCFDLGDC